MILTKILRYNMKIKNKFNISIFKDLELSDKNAEVIARIKAKMRERGISEKETEAFKKAFNLIKKEA